MQPNNTTRIIEYPWAYHALALDKGATVLEIGGGLSGFQFALARSGYRVINVDPGMDSFDNWPVNHDAIARLNTAFRTDVMLHNCELADAPLVEESVEAVFSISVLEHVPPEQLPPLVRRVFALLKPGGRFVVSLDLFLNLVPFSSRITNEYGSNIPATLIAESAPFVLQEGDPAELYGYEEFDADRVHWRGIPSLDATHGFTKAVRLTISATCSKACGARSSSAMT
jgi:SAM-dependent methyltransferase